MYFINHCYSTPHTSDRLFLKQWLCYIKQHKKKKLLSLTLAAILNWGHTHYNRSCMNPIQVYKAYTFYTVILQPEGSKITLTNCICTPCFYIIACLNIVINFCSMPATRLNQWMESKSDNLFCHIAHISDITHPN